MITVSPKLRAEMAVDGSLRFCSGGINLNKECLRVDKCGEIQKLKIVLKLVSIYFMDNYNNQSL